MKTALFLFNPHAGKGNIKSGLSKITDTLTRAGFLVTVYPTQARGDAYEKILLWGLSYDRIVVAGGDGMLHEALNAVMKLERKVDLAFIPSGTANDFAIANKIPKAVDKAVELAAGEQRRTIDIGSFNGEYFSYVAAFGAITDIPYTTDQAAKNNLGYLAYLLNAAKYMNPQILLSAARESIWSAVSPTPRQSEASSSSSPRTWNWMTAFSRDCSSRSPRASWNSAMR